MPKAEFTVTLLKYCNLLKGRDVNWLHLAIQRQSARMSEIKNVGYILMALNLSKFIPLHFKRVKWPYRVSKVTLLPLAANADFHSYTHYDAFFLKFHA